MTYRELMKMCTEWPGCLQTREQNIIETNMRYQIWMDQQNAVQSSEKEEENTDWTGSILP